ncbi:LysR substrate-binding domain-containing protein [Mesorhizobium sp.]|uniref:LysR substrate-binding domain-containing protein n=1 Tax=Mesorhizobium sp. TaxID=1871066 RepID=UPI0034502FF1
MLLLSGLGIGSAPVASVSDLLDAGKLSRVLPTWSTPLEALYLYFPSRRHQPAALRAFIAFRKGRAYAPLHLRGGHDGNVDERDGRVGRLRSDRVRRRIRDLAEAPGHRDHAAEKGFRTNQVIAI